MKIIFTILTVVFLSQAYATSLKQLNPKETLLEAYNSSQVLLIGIPNHKNYQSYIYLMELLQEVGGDENLKSIILEGSSNLSQLYENLSTKPTKEVLGSDFIYQGKDISVLCQSPEWSWQLGTFLPFLRKINETRRSKLKVSLIDSVNVFEPLNTPIEGDFQEGSCKLDYLWKLFVTSSNRELQTMNSFKKKFDALKKGEKLIVVYHQSHLIPSFISCNPEYSTSDDITTWTTNYSNQGWFGYFLAEYPKGTIDHKLVLMDERDKEHNPNGVFRFSQYLRNLSPSTSVTWNLKDIVSPFNNITSLDLFMEGSFFSGYMEGNFKQTGSVFDTGDYLIWSEESSELYEYEKSSKYMPKMCKDSVNK